MSNGFATTTSCLAAKTGERTYLAALHGCRTKLLGLNWVS